MSVSWSLLKRLEGNKISANWKSSHFHTELCACVCLSEISVNLKAIMSYYQGKKIFIQFVSVI